MKNLIIVLLSALLIFACNSSSYSDDKISADNYNFSGYTGKTVKRIWYCDNCGQSGDYLYIEFTDGKLLTVWAYKYNMKIKY